MTSIPGLFSFSFEYDGRTVDAAASRELVEDILGASADAETMWAWVNANFGPLTNCATRMIEQGHDELFLVIQSKDIGW